MGSPVSSLNTVILGTGYWIHWCGLEGACPHLVTVCRVSRWPQEPVLRLCQYPKEC